MSAENLRTRFMGAPQLSVAAGFCVMILCFPPVVLAQQSGDDVVSRLIEGRRANFQKMRDFSMKAVTHGQRVIVNAGASDLEISREQDELYACSGNKYRLESKFAVTFQGGSGRVIESHRVSNGIAMAYHVIEKDQQKGALYRAEKPQRVYDVMIALFDDAYFAETLDTWTRSDGGYHKKAEETMVNGQPAYMVEASLDLTSVGTYQGAVTFRWWALPDKGCLVAKYEARGSKGELLEERTYDDPEQLASGTWINHKMEQTTYDEGQVYDRRVVTISDVKENQTFSADYFEYKFPPGLPTYSEFTKGMAVPHSDLMKDMKSLATLPPATAAPVAPPTPDSSAPAVAHVNSSENASVAGPAKPQEESDTWLVLISLGVIAVVIAVWLLSRRAAGRGRGGDKPS